MHRLVIVGVGVIVVACVAMGVGYVVQGQNERGIAANAQKWCPLLAVLIQQSGDAKPAPGRATRVITEVQKLYDEYHCTA